MSAAADQRRARRRELENFYTDTKRQQAFFKFLESPKTTCPARNFLFWLDVEAYRLQRRLAKSGGVAMTRTNDYEVCRTVFEKYVRTGAAYPIFMPNYSKLEITSAMAEFKKAISEPGDAMALCPIGEHIFDEAQNAVEVSLYRALAQFERELQQEKKVVDAVISTDAEGCSVFISGSFSDLINWFFLDCADEKFVPEFNRFLCIYRSFESPQGLFECITQALRNPGAMTTNSFDKDLIIARSRAALRMWISSSFYCDLEGDQALLQRLLECISFIEKEYDDASTLLQTPTDFPTPQAPSRELDLARWSATEIAEQLTLVDAFQYYAMSPEELFSLGDPSSAPHITALLERATLVSTWVATCILRAPKPGATLKFFVSVLEKLFALNSYSAIAALLRGFDHPSVARLRKAFKNLDKGEKEFLPELRTLCDVKDLYVNHVERLLDVPCIPLVSMHVQMLTDVYSKNANKLQTDRGINFLPTRAVADQMWHFLRFQRHRYYDVSTLKVKTELYSQLLHMGVLSDAQLNELSLQQQPLDRKEKSAMSTLRGDGSPQPSASPLSPGRSGILSPGRPSILSPRSLFSRPPKKTSDSRFSIIGGAPRQGRSGSLGDGDEM